MQERDLQLKAQAICNSNLNIDQDLFTSTKYSNRSVRTDRQNIAIQVRIYLL